MTGEWSEKEEILRLDNQIREELGYPRRADAYAQPWIYGKQEYEHRVSLRFHINSEIDITDVRLALENADITEVFWNNRKIEDPAEGYYVDKQIRTVKLDGVKTGENILEVHIPYHANVNVEAMYLLGDFGVKVGGCTAVLTEPVRELAFGDICTQGAALLRRESDPAYACGDQAGRHAFRLGNQIPESIDRSYAERHGEKKDF